MSLCLLFFCLCGQAVRAEDSPEALPAETVSKFAENVLLHVVLHEVGHGLIREFDLPVLGNEETMADAFATHYLIHYLPDRALDVLKARTVSLMMEANQVPREEWTVRGEHDNDARRAFQIAALAVAADPKKYSPIAMELGLTDGEVRDAADYGAEIHRSWRRILRPLVMPPGMESQETRLTFDPSCKLSEQIRKNGLATEIDSALKRFDWHSQVTVAFQQGDGGAAWGRSTRSIVVKSEYVRRFIQQGKNMSR